jgi:hypothetical protein
MTTTLTMRPTSSKELGALPRRKLWQFKFRSRSISEETVAVEDSDSEDGMLEDAEPLPGQRKSQRIEATTHGCLKISSQDTSLSMQYGTGSEHRKKSLHWSTIDVYKHEARLGDNPCVSSGPPVTISWKAHDHQTFSLDEFESTRPQPRCKGKLLSSRTVRENTLFNAGYSWRELEEASLDAAVISQERAMSSRDGRLKGKLRGKFQRWAARATRHVGRSR